MLKGVGSVNKRCRLISLGLLWGTDAVLVRMQSLQGRSFCFSDFFFFFYSVKGLIMALLKEPEAACSNVGNKDLKLPTR